MTMCAVSAIYDYFDQWPYLMPGAVPFSPYVPSEPHWTRETFEEFKEIIRRLDALDHKLDQPECEEPAKAAWMAEVEALVGRPVWTHEMGLAADRLIEEARGTRPHPISIDEIVNDLRNTGKPVIEVQAESGSPKEQDGG